jgi:CHAT domain-containing protein
MEKGEYVEESIDATTIGNFARLSDAGGSRPLVIINACQVGRLGYQLTSTGGLAKAFLCAGAGLFVAALWSVGDVPARKFVIEFYSQLLKGETVSDATIASREKARAEGEATWLAYVVYAHPNARLERV